MAEQQPIFSLKGFRCIVVQEIGIPSISLFSLIDQSVMLNSPFLPNVLFDGVGQDIVFEITIARKEFSLLRFKYFESPY